MLKATVKTTTYMGWILGVGRRFDGKWIGWILDENAALVKLVRPAEIYPNSETEAKTKILASVASIRAGFSPGCELHWLEDAAAR